MSLEFSILMIFFFLFRTLSSELHSQGVSHWEFSFPFPQVKVLHNQLILFHNAIAAYFAGNQQQLEQTLKQFHIKLKLPGGETPSWLEEHWLSQHSWNMCTPKRDQIQKKKKAKMFLSLLSLFTPFRTLNPVNKCLNQETV